MRKKEIYYHLAGWSLYVLYLIIGQLYISPSKMPLFNFTMVFVKVVEFYVCYLWVYPKFLNKDNIPMLIGGILVALASFIALRYLIEQVITVYLFNAANYWGYTFLSYTLDNVYFGTSGIVLSAAVYSSFSSLYKEQENKSLREEKVQAELAFLKSQINPHFLYNTLNYIYSLAYPVSDKLADAIIKLSTLMRYMLNESKDGMIDLQREVDYLHNYIEIYQLRFEDNFNVDFKAEGDIAGKRLASLVLIPFVENAFKHGVVDDLRRPVRIHLKVVGTRLIFTVSNKINRNQKDHSSGVGLVNIRRRLELIYPKQHELLASENGQTYKTTVNIELV